MWLIPELVCLLSGFHLPLVALNKDAAHLRVLEVKFKTSIRKLYSRHGDKINRYGVSAFRLSRLNHVLSSFMIISTRILSLNGVVFPVLCFGIIVLSLITSLVSSTLPCCIHIWINWTFYESDASFYIMHSFITWKWYCIMYGCFHHQHFGCQQRLHTSD